jgi:hypothetical protein
VILHESKFSLKGFNGAQNFKNVNNCLNAIIALYLEICDGQWSNISKVPCYLCCISVTNVSAPKDVLHLLLKKCFFLLQFSNIVELRQLYDNE